MTRRRLIMLSKPDFYKISLVPKGPWKLAGSHARKTPSALAEALESSYECRHPEFRCHFKAGDYEGRCFGRFHRQSLSLAPRNEIQNLQKSSSKLRITRVTCQLSND